MQICKLKKKTVRKQQNETQFESRWGLKQKEKDEWGPGDLWPSSVTVTGTHRPEHPVVWYGDLSAGPLLKYEKQSTAPLHPPITVSSLPPSSPELRLFLPLLSPIIADFLTWFEFVLGDFSIFVHLAMEILYSKVQCAQYNVSWRRNVLLFLQML